VRSQRTELYLLRRGGDESSTELENHAVKLRYAVVGSTTHKLEFPSNEVVVLNGKSLKYDLKRIDECCYSLLIEGFSHELLLMEASQGHYALQIGTYSFDVRIDRLDPLLREKTQQGKEAGAHTMTIQAPMPGMVARVQVKPGDHVASGGAILVLEAMKMENEIRSPCAGIIKTVHAKEHTQVERNDALVSIEVL